MNWTIIPAQPGIVIPAIEYTGTDPEKTLYSEFTITYEPVLAYAILVPDTSSDDDYTLGDYELEPVPITRYGRSTDSFAGYDMHALSDGCIGRFAGKPRCDVCAEAIDRVASKVKWDAEKKAKA